MKKIAFILILACTPFMAHGMMSKLFPCCSAPQEVEYESAQQPNELETLQKKYQRAVTGNKKLHGEVVVLRHENAELKRQQSDEAHKLLAQALVINQNLERENNTLHTQLMEKDRQLNSLHHEFERRNLTGSYKPSSRVPQTLPTIPTKERQFKRKHLSPISPRVHDIQMGIIQDSRSTISDPKLLHSLTLDAVSSTEPDSASSPQPNSTGDISDTEFSENENKSDT